MSNIDDLPMQDVKLYDQLGYDDIMTLFDYHPWNSGMNPNIDKITHKLLNLKKEDNNAARKYSVDTFKKALKDSILPLVTTENNVCCVVPSHNENKVSLGMREIVSSLKKDFNFVNNHTHLNRTCTVDKAATGGCRSIQHHLDSITVVDPEGIVGKTVFLFDDITSTGNSLDACKQLLLEAGADKVVMIAFGQTR